jgi:hypothetical protein
MLNAEDIPESQPNLHPTDHQPVIIEQYRGPLLDQQPAARYLAHATQAAATEHTESETLVWQEADPRWLVSSRQWLGRLATPFSWPINLLRSDDEIVGRAKRGVALGAIVATTLIPLWLAFVRISDWDTNALMYELSIQIGMVLLPLIWFVGLIDSLWSLVYFRRSRHRDQAFRLSLIGLEISSVLLLFVAFFIIAALIYRPQIPVLKILPSALERSTSRCPNPCTLNAPCVILSL